MSKLYKTLLPEFLILRILKQYPNSTIYEIQKITEKTTVSIPYVTIYPIVRGLMERNLVVITGRRYVKHGIDPEHGLCRQCKRSGVSHKRNSYEHTLTSEGHRRLIQLESILQVCMSMRLYGHEIR